MITTSVTEAAECLQQGQVLAYPTEAVWGLGCDPFNEQAFQKILELKQRPIEKGVILLAGHISQVEHLLTFYLKQPNKKLLIVGLIINLQKEQQLGYYLLANIFLHGLKVSILLSLFESLHILYVWHYAMLFMALLSRLVRTQVDKNLHTHYRMPANTLVHN